MGSSGKSKAISPAAMNNAPEMKIGTEEVRFAYNATMGALPSTSDQQLFDWYRGNTHMTPKMRFAVATSALPVPREFVGNTSGEKAYRTPYMIYWTDQLTIHDIFGKTFTLLVKL
jgi:hypothetical protein